MTVFEIGVFGLALCFVLIFLRMPVAFAFGLAAIVGISMIRGWDGAFYTLGSMPFSTMSMYVWSVVPLFILMGFLAMHSGMATEFYDGVQRWVGHVRGGLANAVILGNTGFGACTGDPVSAGVTFTAISLPQMRRFKYDDKLTLGAIAAGAALAGYIPPSMSAILYGAMTQTSIGQLFIAGIFPGLVYAGLCVMIIQIVVRRNPAAGPPGPKSTWSERFAGSKGMWALAVVFVVIIGGIFLGLFTPTEAGGMGAFTVLVIGLARRKLTWEKLKEAAVGAALAIGMIGLLLICTIMFNTMLAVTGVPTAIAEAIAGVTGDPYGTMWVIVGVMIVLGMFIDGLALFLLMIPILYPLAIDQGFHPIHFAMILHACMTSGGITPPFGIMVFAIHGVARDVPVYDIFRGAAPFLGAIIVLQAIVLYWPDLTLFLPNLMWQ